MILFLNKLATRITQARFKALTWNSRNAYTRNNGVWCRLEGDLSVGGKRILPSQLQCSERGSNMCRAKGSLRPLNWCHPKPEHLHGSVAGNTRTRTLYSPSNALVGSSSVSPTERRHLLSLARWRTVFLHSWSIGLCSFQPLSQVGHQGHSGPSASLSSAV